MLSEGTADFQTANSSACTSGEIGRAAASAARKAFTPFFREVEPLAEALYKGPNSLAAKSLGFEKALRDAGTERAELRSRLDSGLAGVNESCVGQVVEKLDDCIAVIDELKIDLGGLEVEFGPRRVTGGSSSNNSFFSTDLNRVSAEVGELLSNGLEGVRVHITNQILSLRSRIFSELDSIESAWEDSVDVISSSAVEKVEPLLEKAVQSVSSRIKAARDKTLTRIERMSDSMDGRLSEVSNKVGEEAEGVSLRLESVCREQAERVEGKVAKLFEDLKTAIERDNANHHASTRNYQADDLQTFVNVLLDNSEAQTRKILGSKTLAESDVSLDDVCSMVARAGGFLSVARILSCPLKHGFIN